MRLEQLRYYIAVVESGSFNKASRILFISQPAVTNAIKCLEEEIEAPLLIRANQGVSPTSQGWKVYEDACRFLKQFDAMVQSWRPAREQEELEGQARILMLPTIAAWFSEHVLPALKALQPGLSIILEDSQDASFEKNLRAKRCNIGLTALMQEEEAEAAGRFEKLGYQTRPLHADEQIICLAAAHPLAAKPWLEPEDWDSLKFCATPNYKAYEGLTPHPSLKCGLIISEYMSSRENLIRYLEKGTHAGIFLEMMMLNHWAVAEGRLILKKIRGISLYPSRYALISLPESMLSPAESWLASWIGKNCAHYLDSPQ